jgi:hypothetical protein
VDLPPRRGRARPPRRLGRAHRRRCPRRHGRGGVGPAGHLPAYERIFGSRVLGRWPFHPVVDGLDQVEILLDSGCLLIHPRCKHLIAAFQNDRRARRGGEILDYPEDPQNPHEDLMDALRGGIRIAATPQ